MDSYQVELNDEVHRSIRWLPGHMWQRIVRAIQALRQEPRPHNSRTMDMTTSAVNLAPDMEVRRVRMSDWRIVYLIEEQGKLVSVLAVRQRPPYQYDDLGQLLKN